jgi:hypothetical protein
MKDIGSFVYDVVKLIISALFLCEERWKLLSVTVSHSNAALLVLLAHNSKLPSSKFKCKVHYSIFNTPQTFPYLTSLGNAICVPQKYVILTAYVMT